MSPDARIAQEEIFGPVLAVIRAADLTEALTIANGTDYALTGGIYLPQPAALDRARREFLVGNLYLNRPITGALVDRQPFGGFKMSGIGSKAGGPDYLLQFVLPAPSRNTVRRGFAPPDMKSSHKRWFLARRATDISPGRKPSETRLIPPEARRATEIELTIGIVCRPCRGF